MANQQQISTHSWHEALLTYFKPKVVVMLFLGFSAGLPLLLIFSSLSIWLREAGVARSEVTYFSLAALAFSFKFIWAPLIDKLPLPILASLLGRRRSWLLVSQLAIALSIISMAMVDPVYGLQSMAIAVVALGFSAATQDIVIDAYRIEAADADNQAAMSAIYIAGYRIGMVVSGAGSLIIAAKLAFAQGVGEGNYSYFAWQYTYFIMAGFTLVGIITTLFIKEPKKIKDDSKYIHSLLDYIRFVFLFGIFISTFVVCYIYFNQLGIANSNGFLGFLYESMRLLLSLVLAIIMAYSLVLMKIINRNMVYTTYVEPLYDFYSRYKNIFFFVVLLIGLYRVSDIILGTVANIFYTDLGFSKEQIGYTSKTFGLIMTIVGGFAGGILSVRFGVIRILLLGAVLSAITNLLFIYLASMGDDIVTLGIVIAADNLSAGLAMAAFVAYLSSLTSLSFTATQYAIFSSLMTLLPKTLSAYSGTIVEQFGYNWFFIGTTLIGLPVIALIFYLILKEQKDGALNTTSRNNILVDD
ncbi:AmpG permease [hydrothermal vent metagenome]|uniref:AmpG permease n=1 Tax=hydrothermal vent metagenome TaxID=652676 RepID=A0A3B1AIE7_9ZZZZ